MSLAIASQPATSRLPTNIPAESLTSALKSFAKERTLQVLYRDDLVQGIKTKGAVGTLTAAETLDRLLRGTGLTYRYVDEKTVTITPASQTHIAPPTRSIRPGQASVPASSQSHAEDNGNGVDPVTKEGAQEERKLAEVIVTAQKTKQSILDVPMPVSVLTARALVQLNEPNITDYYASVPGLSIQPTGEGDMLLSIDGITTGGYANPTVGVTVNDVPFGGSLQVDHGDSFPDFDPSDWSSIEVLNGPQGTVYGASSLGGLIRFVTVNPTPSSAFGRLEGGAAGIQNGAEVGYNFDGFINLPLTDDMAVRLSAYGRRDPGYIDNPALHIKGVNEAHVAGVHLGVFWQPMSEVTAEFDALFQDSHGSGQNVVFEGPNTQGFGDLQQNFVAGCCTDTRKWQLYSLDVNASFGGFSLTSVSGLQIFQSDEGWDLSLLFLPLPIGPMPYPQADSAPVVDSDALHKFSQEIRVDATFLQNLHLLLGGFYTRENSAFAQNLPVTDTLTGAVLTPSQGFDTVPLTYQETAAFADLTYHFTRQMDLTIGARASHIEESQSGSQGGALFGLPLSPPTPIPTTHESATPVTFLVTPRVKFSSRLMTYIRVASGYGAGAVNPPPIGGAAIPPQYGPDKTLEYQLGLKARFLGDTVSLDTDYFHIRWTDIQLFLVTPEGSGYEANGSGATSQGVDMSVTGRVLPFMSLTGAVTYDQAALTRAFPVSSTAIGLPGEPLPYAPLWSGHLGFDANVHFLPVANSAEYFGGEVDYVGHREGEFSAAVARQYYGGYAKVSLHAGIRKEAWDVQAYADNLMNRRGLISGGVGDSGYGPVGFYLIRPRTIGVTVSRDF